MRFLPFMLIVALGCSQAPQGPQLHFADVGSDEFKNPMPFALRFIVNNGMSVKVDAFDGECRTVQVVSTDPNAKLPNATMHVGLTADMNKTLADGDVLTLEGSTEVWGVVGWDLPDDSPPVVGFFEARFTLKRGGVDVFTTPPYAFIMQNREGVFEAIVAEAAHDPEDARALLNVIHGMEGERSACIEELRWRLKVTLPPAA